MKVKDYIGWLQNDKWTKNGFTWHYFPNKKSSACGKAKHPKTQFNAAYVIGEHCKVCQKFCKSEGIGES